MTERLEVHVNCLSVGGPRLALHDTESGFGRELRSAGFMNRRSSLAAANLPGRIIRYMVCSCMVSLDAAPRFDGSRGSQSASVLN